MSSQPLGNNMGNIKLNKAFMSWQERLAEEKFFHALTYAKYKRLHSVSFVVLLVMSTFLGSSLVLEFNPKIIAVIGLVIAITSSVVTFFQLSKKAEQHRVAYEQLGVLERKLSLALVFAEMDAEKALSFSEDINKEWRAAIEIAPVVYRPQK